MSNQVNDNTAALLLQLADGGLKLSSHQYQEIRNSSLAKEVQDAFDDSPSSSGEILPEERHLWLYSVPVATEGPNKGKALEGGCYYDKVPKEIVEKWKDVEIKRSHWRPDDPSVFDDEFRRFINSHIPAFDQIAFYEPFYLYCEQARRWREYGIKERDVSAFDRFAWENVEQARIADNKLYGLDEYISIKEDNMLGGRRKYHASTPQALLAFLMDRGNSFELVKGRQAAITSTMMAMASLEALHRPSFTGVFMVHKKDGTGKGLFRDKFQSTLQALPAWMIADLDVSKGFSSETAILDFSDADSKLMKGRDISEFKLLSSEDSMNVNGKTPTWSFFDESQNIPTFQELRSELDPTMFQFNMSRGRMELVRQAAAWGTGSSNNIGKGAFENDYKGLLEAWTTGEPTDGWVPVFMDWTCRPGMTLEFYLKQRRKYLRGQTEETKGLSMTERQALFGAHYPRRPDDAFMASHTTLIPMDMIVKQQNRITDRCHRKGLQPVPGRFEPVYDLSVELPPGSPFKHPVKDAIWRPAHMDDLDAPVFMFMPPEEGWSNRYTQGTDPIANDGGFSRFSSAIWDSVGRVIHAEAGDEFVPTVSCILNYRNTNTMELFMQCALMGMYYKNKGQRACRELLEINVGHRYADLKCGPVFNLRESLLTRHELLPKYKIGNATNIIGVDLKGGKGSRKESLQGDLVELLRNHGHNIWYYTFWSQVRNISVDSKPDGSVQWGARNKNVHNDDLVYAVAYAELCARCINKKPEHLHVGEKKYRMKRVNKRRNDAYMTPYVVYERQEVTKF